MYLINEMNELYKSMNLDFEFILYTKDMFQNQVLNPVIERAKTVADTSELFMRSVQMNNLFNRNRRHRNSNQTESRNKDSHTEKHI
jgi:hypothetical protein